MVETRDGAFGEGPALAQFVPVTLTLPRGAWRAQAIDSAGANLHPVPVVTVTDSKLSTVLQGAALSYSLTR